MSSRTPTSSRKKGTGGGSAGNSSVSRNVLCIIVMIAAVMSMFLLIAYVTHVRLAGDEFETTKQFVYNKIHGFQQPSKREVNHSNGFVTFLNDIPL